jgi:K+-transporting ATPase KdpF subunit
MGGRDLDGGWADGDADLRRFRGAAPARAGGESAVIEDVVGLVVAGALIVYLVVALLFPERF